ncbi:hypothetical protein mRhiFer1_009121 [Rhinolophus ferrumequinum]|uniref:Uncharacterized protein n=1 Tax=Rhinolophus ferrumequinum TaxID=59479 RepID=A0A7J7SIU9_RHIFE|nr:hypothetical protein mRhiFer1_009121 [Rhinolophus ferrumequinum]
MSQPWTFHLLDFKWKNFPFPSPKPRCGEPRCDDPENNGSLPCHVVGGLRCPTVSLGSLVSLTEARNEAEVRGGWRRKTPGGTKDPHSVPKAATYPKVLGKAIVAFLYLLPDVISNILSQDTL